MLSIAYRIEADPGEWTDINYLRRLGAERRGLPDIRPGKFPTVYAGLQARIHHLVRAAKLFQVLYATVRGKGSDPALIIIIENLSLEQVDS
jgi:hypothetical protein